MSYTFNLGGSGLPAQIAAVRDLADDVTSSNAEGGGEAGTDYFLTDERIAKRLADALTELGSDANDVELALWAAGSCLSTLADNQAYVLSKQTTAGEETDGPAVAKEIRNGAAALQVRATRSLAKRRADLLIAGSRIAEPDGGGVTVSTRF